MKRNILFLVSVLSVLVMISYSCRDPLPPKGIVTVIDNDGKAIEGAIVTVQPNTDKTSFIKDVQITDETGKTYHEFKYEGILNVTAQKSQAVYEAEADTFGVYVYEGQSSLRLEYDKTDEITITIRSYY